MDWLPPDLASRVLLLVGVAVGVCYGFDGWTGSKKITAFPSTPRIKNLRYALGGLFFTLIADFKGWEVTTPKVQLLTFYVEGFLTSASLTVAVMAVVVVCSCRKLGRLPEAPFMSGYSPLTDYLLFGSSYYYSNKRKVLAEAGERRAAYYANFWINYVTQINQAVAVVGGLSSTQSPKEAMIYILKTIVGVVRKYHNLQDDSKINANCMVAFPVANPPHDLQNRLRFARSSGAFSHYLAIQEYAFPEGKENFVLPVEDTNQAGWQKFILIGAPRVFAESARLELVDDTLKAKFPHGFPSDVKKRIEVYFHGKHFRSFASLSIIHDARAVGVLNVESDSTFIFGKSDLTKK